MPEKPPSRKRRPAGESTSDDGPASGRKSGGGSSRGGLSGGKVAQRARQELADITGLQPEGVTSLERSEDGGWKVTIEMLELERVPPTDDVLGSYEVTLDEDGELVGYERLARYTRSQVQGGSRGDR